MIARNAKFGGWTLWLPEKRVGAENTACETREGARVNWNEKTSSQYCPRVSMRRGEANCGSIWGLAERGTIRPSTGVLGMFYIILISLPANSSPSGPPLLLQRPSTETKPKQPNKTIIIGKPRGYDARPSYINCFACLPCLPACLACSPPQDSEAVD